MQKKLSNCLTALLFFMFSAIAQADLKPGARYFTGQINVNLSQPTTCYLEAFYSQDLSILEVRSISTLQHLSTAGQAIWVALGPYTANYIAAKSLYRFQDPAPKATVKDIVINTSGQVTPIKYGFLFWHAEAGHHDPVFCENLVENSSSSQLEAIDKVFSNFDSMKP
jgi:hypothetical protein